MLLSCVYATSLNSDEQAGIVFQVKSGTLFNNILITDEPEYAKQLAEETWGKHKDVSGTSYLIFESSSSLNSF